MSDTAKQGNSQYQEIDATVAIGCGRRFDQAIWVPLYRAESRRAAFAGSTIRWSITARTSRRCCSATTRKSRCRSPMATPRRRGKPMMAIVHDVVGLLHAPMGIYYAYIDRCPVFIVGATGPMDEKYRRPFIDWIHTAFAQGDVIRNFTKWDYQPGSIHGVPDSFARAYSIMMSEPQGPGLHVLRLGDARRPAERRDGSTQLCGQSAIADCGRSPRLLNKPPTCWSQPTTRSCLLNTRRACPSASNPRWSSPRPSARRFTISTSGSAFPTAIR